MKTKQQKKAEYKARKMAQKAKDSLALIASIMPPPIVEHYLRTRGTHSMKVSILIRCCHGQKSWSFWSMPFERSLKNASMAAEELWLRVLKKGFTDKDIVEIKEVFEK